MEDWQYRNPVALPDGRIDCEIRPPDGHPLRRFGEWFPFTADENDPEQFGRDVHAYLALLLAGVV